MTRKTVVLYLLGILVSYGLFETTSFVGLHGLKLLEPDLFINGFIDKHFDSITDHDRVKFLENIYDPILGWDNRPLKEIQKQNRINQTYKVSYDSDGSRADGLPGKELLINTYGDSFTWCDEVGNQQTWQYFLESRIGYEVKNFGVGAYGTGQAVLKLEKHIEQGRIAPITVLGIMEENVNRVVNSFWPLYIKKGLKLGFKPSLRLASSGQIELIPNPYNNIELSLDDLRSMAHRIAKENYWARSSPKIVIRYPYSFQPIRAAYVRVTQKLRVLSGKVPQETVRMNLWETEEGGSVMHYLVDRFITTAATVNSLPIILFIPRPDTMRGSDAPQYTQFKKQIQRRYSDLAVVDLMDHEFDKERFHVQPYKGHASAYGNQVIARVIEKAYRKILEQRKLVTASRPNGTKLSASSP